MIRSEWGDLRPSRRVLRSGFVTLNYAAAGLVMTALTAIVVKLIWGSRPAWHWSTLTTVSQGLGGGLANALVGTLWLALLTLVLVIPLGVGTATYLAVYAPPKVAATTLLIGDVLAGVPSIVFGYVGYIGLVIALGWGFSALAAALTLTAMVLPYMIKNTDIALRQVPVGLADQAQALGFGRIRLVWSILWPSAGRGIVGGAMMAMAIAMGETAPLIYTAEWSQNMPSLALTHHSVGYLTYVVWTFIQEPYPQAIALANMAGLMLIALIAVVAILGRLVSGRR